MTTVEKDPSVISLEMLEPEPLPSPTVSTDSASSSPSSILSTNSLSGYISPLMKIQRYSSYASTAFIGIHLASTALIPLASSIANANKQILLFRPTYQGFLTEPLVVIAPITIHVFSGLALRIIRGRLRAERSHTGSINKSKDRKYWLNPPMSTVSILGWILAPTVAAHYATNRLLPLWKGVTDSINLSFVAHGFALHPITSWAAYVTITWVASGHFVLGTAKYLGWDQPKTGGQPAKKRRETYISAASGILMAIWLGGAYIVSKGGLGKGWQAREWNEVYDLFPWMI